MIKTDNTGQNTLIKTGPLRFNVPENREGQRLDHYLVEIIPSISRNRLSNLIRKGLILVNRKTCKAGNRLKKGDDIEVNLPEPEPLSLEPEKIAFEVLHEDEDILVISKPPGIVVHPAAGHKKGTLVHGLLNHLDNLPGIGGIERPGIVHRLDKDTSGVMVIAKTDRSHQGLIELFKKRQVKKIYHAIITGRPSTESGIISEAIGRHRSNRKKMSVLQNGGREAVTSWSVLEEFSAPLTYIEARPETGRTHQIRVHMAHSGYPIAGDELYSNKLQRQVNEEYGISRHCLHAFSLKFEHPVTQKQLKFISPVWPDMMALLERLRQ